MYVNLRLQGQEIQWPKEEEQTMIYKSLHRKLKILRNTFIIFKESIYRPLF